MGVRCQTLGIGAAALVLAGGLSITVGASADRGDDRPECLSNGSKCRPAPSPVPQVIARLAIDADPTGNTPASIGPTDQCLSLGSGATATIDIVVESIPPVVAQKGGILGFQFELRYNQGRVQVIGVDDRQMLAANGNAVPVEITDPLPDSDGKLSTLSADLGTGAPESGAGVLSRITIERIAPGPAKLEVANAIIVDASNNTYAIGDVQDARIVWGGRCPG